MRATRARDPARLDTLGAKSQTCLYTNDDRGLSDLANHP
jgi:hypothetical protein